MNTVHGEPVPPPVAPLPQPDDPDAYDPRLITPAENVGCSPAVAAFGAIALTLVWLLPPVLHAIVVK